MGNRWRTGHARHHDLARRCAGRALSLCSLYFLLANLMNRFIYLKMGLSIILAFVGLKMIFSHLYPIPNYLSLLVVVVILAATIGISMVVTKNRASADIRK